MSTELERKRKFDNALGKFLLITFIVGTIFFISYCCFFPLLTRSLTGQVCGYLGNTVPQDAEDKFIKLVLDNISNSNYSGIPMDSRSINLSEVETLRSAITENYDIVGGDYTFGLHELRIRFDDETTIYMAYRGGWTPCPDFDVTDQEVLSKLTLVSIYIDEYDD